MKKADMIIDLQYGSTGKGLFAGWLAKNREYDVVVNANMPNAGHTYIDENGQKMVHKVLPSGVVSPACKIALLGPGSVFDPLRLSSELNHLFLQCGYGEHLKVIIHPSAVVLSNSHMLAEQSMDSIGSTKQGAGAAVIEKIKRSTTGAPLLAGHVVNKEMISRVTGGQAMVGDESLYRSVLRHADSILLEGAQGYSLGLSQRFWPYTTSRDCTPARFMADMAIPLPMLRTVYGVARVHPIRVGGTSGDCYPDQTELTWESLGQTPELTTVTKKVRRVFSFSHQQMRDALWECAPHSVFLNFVNYDKDAADKIIREYADVIHYIGVGPNHTDVIPRKNCI